MEPAGSAAFLAAEAALLPFTAAFALKLPCAIVLPLAHDDGWRQRKTEHGNQTQGKRNSVTHGTPQIALDGFTSVLLDKSPRASRYRRAFFERRFRFNILIVYPQEMNSL